jgi:tripartite-type tricarboxylate transporter receptor subunit TctC
MTLRRTILLGTALGLPALHARAQGWPNRPIRIIVPSVTGGFDNYARMMTPRLSEIFGQPVVIENRPGANGNIGMQEVQRATPDGHTLLFAAVGSLSINVSIYRGMPLDPVEDLAAVACPVTSPMVWVANPETGPRSLMELVERARAEPGKLDYALPSAGTINHLIAEGFKLRHHLDIPAVPYRGTAPAQLDVVAGRVPIRVDSLGAGWGHISGGRLRALALTSRRRSSRAPEVPTAIELGLDDTEYVAWYAYMAPKATPPEIVQRLNSALNRVALEDGYTSRLREMGANTQAMTPAEQLSFMQAERRKWGDIARAAQVEVV